jgi:hypothetical protein
MEAMLHVKLVGCKHVCRVSAINLLRIIESPLSEPRDKRPVLLCQASQSHFAPLAHGNRLFDSSISHGNDVRTRKKRLKVGHFLGCYLMIAERFDLGDLPQIISRVKPLRLPG